MEKAYELTYTGGFTLTQPSLTYTVHREPYEYPSYKMSDIASFIEHVLESLPLAIETILIMLVYLENFILTG